MLMAASLGGCASMNERVAESIGGMPGIGLPAGAPERPAERAAFPAVHDMPTPRTTAVLTSQEQREAERELVSARDQQKTAAAPPPEPPPAPPPARKPAKPSAAAKPLPPTSGRTIY